MDAEGIRKLALRCSAHLQQEEAMLRETRKIVEATREALLRRDGEQLLQHVERHEHTTLAAEGLRKSREDLRSDIARVFDLPHQRATVSRLIEQTPAALGNELRATQRRLLQLASRVRALHRANAVLAIQTNHLVAGALQNLLGEQLTGSGYARTGHMRSSSGPRLIDTDT